MFSSPSSAKQRSPKRKSPKRTPLQERTSSHANELSSRLRKEPSSSQENIAVYNATPFPTKASQVLLPSTLRTKKSLISPLSDTFGYLSDSDAGTSNVSRSSRGSQPTVRLKRSVKALRDLYEAQSEEPSSRPSTATSPLPRPSTANSFRLRSISSSDSLSGPLAWDALRRISEDDLALLPTLPAGRRVLRRLSSKASFSSAIDDGLASSSSNYEILGATSSPRQPNVTAPKRFQQPIVTNSSDPISTFDSSSSSNVVRLGHSSSSVQLPSSDQSSSPNIIRLAHTSSSEQFPGNKPVSSPNVVRYGSSSPEPSPATVRVRPSSHVVRSRSSSSSLGKRKRAGPVEGGSFANRAGARNPLASSPPSPGPGPGPSTSSPPDPDLPSSAPHSIQQSSAIDDSSPFYRVLGRDDALEDSSSVAETHASLQAALSSSPPRIQYPVVRAPLPTQRVGISVPKRNSRSMSTEGNSTSRYSTTLSIVPSEGSWSRSRRVSEISMLSSAPDVDMQEYLKSDELAPASSYIINEDANDTQVHLPFVSRPHAGADRSQCDYDCDCERSIFDPHDHEATDEVTALPLSRYRSPPLRAARSGSFGENSSGSHSTVRLNSLVSYLNHSRQNSFHRPGSSSSSIHSTVVPSWAKRYYSGMYRDSFTHLYASASYLSLRDRMALQTSIPVSSLTPQASRPNTQRSNDSPGFRHIHQAMTDRVADLLGKKRPKLEARKSHALPGIGPLVSNPVAKVRAPEPTAKPYFASGALRRQSYHHPGIITIPTDRQNRALSMSLSPADPRAHWAGMITIHATPSEDGRGSTYIVRHQSMTYSADSFQTDSRSYSGAYTPAGDGMRRSWQRWSSPHLHHDARLNTGSSTSRGFGHPFNAKSKWKTGIPDLTNNEASYADPIWKFDRRSVQVLCFMFGFVVPLTWFIGAFLPLPPRPNTFGDIEKSVHRESQLQRQSNAQRLSHAAEQLQYRHESMRYSHDPTFEQERGSLDVLAKLRFERHNAGVSELKYQNARWWRNLNRWMCAVGVVVVVLVIVLAILGTKNWSS